MTLTNLVIHLSFACFLTVTSYTITYLMVHRFLILDHPNWRSLHSSPRPKSGGIAVVATFVIAMIMIYVFGEERSVTRQYISSFTLSGILIAAISFYDDIRNKGLPFKLITQLVAVIFVLANGIVIDKLALPALGYVNLGWLGYLVSFLWIIGLTNAYNFMDGIDGLMAGVAVIVSLFFLQISFYEGSHWVYVTCYSVLAGALGFLMWNFPPAKIFMGDVGSAFIGFYFANLAIIAARYDDSHTSFFVMPLLLFNVIYDTAFTFLRRLTRGDDVTKPHRSHLYQLMARMGYSHMEVTLVQYCMCFLQGIGALWMIRVPGDQRVLVFVPFFAIQIAYTMWIMSKAKQLKLEI